MSFRKRIQQTGPIDENTSCFAKTHYMFCQNTLSFVKTLSVLPIHIKCIHNTPVVITLYDTVMTIVQEMTSAPHWPPHLPLSAPPSPLTWLLHCRRHCHRHRCRCHCCRRHHHHRFRCYCCRFLVDCCLPSHCLCFCHRCLPPLLPLLAADAIATVAMAANRCPLLLPPQPLPQFQPLFSLVMFTIIHRTSTILNIFIATVWLIVVYPHAASAFATVACPRHCA